MRKQCCGTTSTSQLPLDPTSHRCPNRRDAIARYHIDMMMASRTKPSRAEPSRAEPSQAKPSQAKPSQVKASQCHHEVKCRFHQDKLSRQTVAYAAGNGTWMHQLIIRQRSVQNLDRSPQHSKALTTALLCVCSSSVKIDPKKA
jgi:hypothetical protein